jgi:hypothetical protein
MQRSRTALTAAIALREYAARMPFVARVPPAAPVPEVRCHGESRGASRRSSPSGPANATAGMRSPPRQTMWRSWPTTSRDNIRHLERRIELLTSQAVAQIAAHSAVQLLRELLVLPNDMTVRALGAARWARSSRLPSGTSVAKPARISNMGNAHIRRALYMPALVAVRREPRVTAFFDQLVARGKKPLQAYVAVMRKLLHAIYGMFTTDTDLAAEQFYVPAASR